MVPQQPYICSLYASVVVSLHISSLNVHKPQCCLSLTHVQVCVSRAHLGCDCMQGASRTADEATACVFVLHQHLQKLPTKGCAKAMTPTHLKCMLLPAVVACAQIYTSLFASRVRVDRRAGVRPRSCVQINGSSVLVLSQLLSGGVLSVYNVDRSLFVCTIIVSTVLVCCIPQAVWGWGYYSHKSADKSRTQHSPSVGWFSTMVAICSVAHCGGAGFA